MNLLCVFSRKPSERVGTGVTKPRNRKTGQRRNQTPSGLSVGVVWFVCCTLLVNVYSNRQMYITSSVHSDGVKQ